MPSIYGGLSYSCGQLCVPALSQVWMLSWSNNYEVPTMRGARYLYQCCADTDNHPGVIKSWPLYHHLAFQCHLCQQSPVSTSMSIHKALREVVLSCLGVYIFLCWFIMSVWQVRYGWEACWLDCGGRRHCQCTHRWIHCHKQLVSMYSPQGWWNYNNHQHTGTLAGDIKGENQRDCGIVTGWSP